MKRRHFLLGSLALAAAPSAPPLRAASARFRSDPFTLGVASGYPLSTGVVLWTRLAPEPLAPDGGLGPESIAVDWEIATDQSLRDVVARGRHYASPQWAHSVHVEVTGLQPARDYWYRFTSGEAVSPIGRTRTAPAADAEPGSLELALASCQHYEHGWFTAYRHMAASPPHAVLHVGDYIYEGGSGSRGVRSHASSELFSLEDYRTRYALYKQDADLQAAHAAAPWLLTWDDHEVDNDYAAAISEEDDDPALFLARRAAAYRAYYEHQPLPRRALPFGPDMRLFARREFGALASVTLLDGRQYRSREACPRPGRAGSNRVSDCAELTEPQRTLLGERQERWLHAGLAASRSRWNLVAQGVVVTYSDELPGKGERFWTDAWSGYPPARERLVASLAQPTVQNPVVLSGDIHAFLVGGVRARPTDPSSRLVAPEFVTTSISTNGFSQTALDAMRADSPDLRHADSSKRGYLRLQLAPQRMTVDLMGLDDIANRNSALRSVRRYVVEAGRPEPVPA